MAKPTADGMPDIGALTIAEIPKKFGKVSRQQRQKTRPRKMSEPSLDPNWPSPSPLPPSPKTRGRRMSLAEIPKAAATESKAPPSSESPSSSRDSSPIGGKKKKRTPSTDRKLPRIFSGDIIYDDDYRNHGKQIVTNTTRSIKERKQKEPQSWKKKMDAFCWLVTNGVGSDVDGQIKKLAHLTIELFFSWAADWMKEDLVIVWLRERHWDWKYTHKMNRKNNGTARTLGTTTLRCPRDKPETVEHWICLNKDMMYGLTPALAVEKINFPVELAETVVHELIHCRIDGSVKHWSRENVDRKGHAYPFHTLRNIIISEMPKASQRDTLFE